MSCFEVHMKISSNYWGDPPSIKNITIHPVVSASPLIWYIRHINYCNLQYINNVNINKAKDLLFHDS